MLNKRTISRLQSHFQSFLKSQILLLLLASCKFTPTGPSEPQTGTVFTLGSKTTLANQVVSSGGGIVPVFASQTQLNGMTLTVPDTAYPISRTFTILYAPITSTTLSSDLVPLTPMITISNGGGYASNPMTVQIPITLPTGSVAGAFFYNESTGELEPIPVDAESGTSITISTCHFSTSTLTSSSRLRGGSRTPLDATISYSDIVILAMDENKLFSTGNQVTEFKLGTDDWEFTNFGSYIAPGGHCAGQSLTSMWYFIEEKNTLGHSLNGYLNPNPAFPTTNMPSGDRLGYRFASVVQHDQVFDHWVHHVSFQSWNPALTFKLFLLSIYVSKQPQSLIMYQSADTGGHAMVCYGVQYTDKLNGKLLIADPNYPGAQKEIDYVNGQLQPYGTPLKVGNVVKVFDRFAVLAKTAYIPWDQVAERWTEVQAKTIGNAQFPSVTLKYYDNTAGAFVSLPSNLTIESDSIKLSWSPAFVAYGIDGTPISIMNGMLPLQYGRNIIGFNFVAKPLPDTNYEWVDFIWDTIFSNQLVIDPQSMTGQPNVSYSWSCSAASIPSNARYEWDFGDQSEPDVLYNEGSASHTFTQSGTFTITLSLYDNAKNQLMGKATATATIGNGGLWSLWHQQNGMQFQFETTRNYSDGSQDNSLMFFPDEVNWIPITWEDTVVTGNLKLLSATSGAGYDSEFCVVNGSFLSDGLTIKTMTCTLRTTSVRYYDSGPLELKDNHVISFTVTNAVGTQIDPNNQILPIYNWMWGGVSSIVSNVSDNDTFVSYDQTTGAPTTTIKTLTSISWGANAETFEILFAKN